MNIIVTGGAGFIGSNLVNHLVDDHDVTVIDNFSTGDILNLTGVKDDITIIEGESSTIEHLDDCDVVFHLGIPSSSPIYKNNPSIVGHAVGDAVSVFEFGAMCGAKVVFASSSSLYNGSIIPNDERMRVLVTDYYTEARYYIERLAELYAELRSVESVGLRFFSVYGKNEHAKGIYANIVSQFLWEMQDGKTPVIYGDGEQTRDFTFVDDVVNACILSMKSNVTGIFNVGTGKRHSFNRVVDMLNAELGTSIVPTYIDNPIKNYVDHTLAYTNRARDVLGFDAKIMLEHGIYKICESDLNEECV